MILSFLNAKSRQTSKSKILYKYLKPFPRKNTLKSVALAVALSVHWHVDNLSHATEISTTKICSFYTWRLHVNMPLIGHAVWEKQIFENGLRRRLTDDGDLGILKDHQ